MEEIHETAKAYYNNLTENQKQNAYQMFLLMDPNGDGSVSISEYVEILGKMGFKSCNNQKFFMELDRDEDGNLDFQEFLSLYYLIKSNRLVFCHGHGCGDFLREVFITCLHCLYCGNKNAFNLCPSCSDGKNFRHNHATFLAFKNQESVTMKANWSELQTELLELILEKLTKNLSFKLTVINIDRFKAVCSSWKKAAKSFTSSPSYTPPPQAPWLMFLTKQLDHFGGRFINVAANNNTVHDLNNMFKGGFLVGASYGWLAILNQITMIPHLLNPFSRAQIQLPLMKSGMINTLVLSSDPSRTKGFIVAVIYSSNYNHRLAFCKHGDETWTELYKDESYRNIAFRNDQIYAISEKYTVDIWDCQTSLFPTEVVRIGNFYRMTIKWLRTKNMGCDLRRTYLVESLGELLIVERMTAYCFPYYTTFGFVISKLDHGAEGGCTSLQTLTLTDRALFIGDKEAISVSIRDFPNLKENSIYFMENYLKVYSLEDDKLSMCDCNTGVYLRQVTSFWMVPNPW